jgi:hypothetical protein
MPHLRIRFEQRPASGETVSNRRVISRLLLFLACTGIGAAQGVPRNPTTGQLSPFDARSAVVPAGSTSTLLAFTLESDTTGGNFFDVSTSDPSVVVSIILPSGTEVTSANAASLGYTFTVVPDGTYAVAQIPSVFAFPGCAPQKVRPSLSGLLFQAIFVVQPAENWLRSDSKTRGQLVPMNAGRNARLDWLRNSRS